MSRNMKLKTLCLATLLAFSGLATAADLIEVYQRARQNDPAYAAARAGHQSAQEKLPQGEAGLLPQVTLGADATHRDVDTGSSGYRGGSHSFTLSLTQPIYRAQNLSALAQARLQVEQAGAVLAQAEQDLILRTAQAYFDVLLADNNIELAKKQKLAIAEQLEQAKRNFEVGVSTITDTHEAQARFDLVTAQELAAQSELEVRRRVLETLIGPWTGILSPLAGDPALAPLTPNSMDHWVSEAEAHSPSLRAQALAKQVADEEVERQRGAHQPTVDLVASYRDAHDVSSGDSRSASIGVQLSLPLYQGGATTSRVREALANQEKARLDLENTRRQVGLQTRQSFLGFSSGIAQVRALKQALASSQSQLDSTKLGLEVGVRTGVDVLNAQQQLFAAQRDMDKAIYDTAIHYLRLKAASGTLSEEDLQTVNRRLKK